MKTNFYDDEIVAGKKILADQLKEAKAILKQSRREEIITAKKWVAESNKFQREN